MFPPYLIGMAIFKRKKQDRQADMQMVMTPPVEAGTYLKQAGQYDKLVSQSDLGELRRTLRKYSNVNETFSIILRLTSMFAAKNPKIVCADTQNQEALNECFRKSQWETFFQSFFKEYLISGEATAYSTWDDDEQCFAPEEIINPDLVQVKEGGKIEAHANPDYADNFDPTINFTGDAWLDCGTGGALLDSRDLIRIVHKNAPWDKRGYPYFAPALTALVQKESLDAALYEQLNQLATPLIIGNVGLKAGELGPNSKAWLPNQAELNQIADQFRQLMMAKTRIGVFKIGVDFKNAFAGDQIANLDGYYQRCEEALLRVVGAGKGLIDGSTGGPFASTAVNRDVYTSFIESLRAVVIEAFQPRIDEAIARLGLHAAEVDDSGYRKEKEELETAVLAFDNEVMKDSNARLQTLATLASHNVPISKQTMADAAEMGINIADQLHEIRKEEEMVQATDTESTVDLQNNPENDVKREDREDVEIKSPNDKRNYK